jgi:DNA repair exonuclease SbcCD ATPase subunit
LSLSAIVLVEVESLKESYAAHKAAIEKRKKKQEEVDAELEKLKPLVKKSKSLLEEKERLQKEIRELKEKANTVEMTLKKVTEDKRAALKEQLRALKGKSKGERFEAPSSPRIGREDPFLSPNLTKANQKDKEDTLADFEISSRTVSKIGRKNETSPTANG